VFYLLFPRSAWLRMGFRHSVPLGELNGVAEFDTQNERDIYW